MKTQTQSNPLAFVLKGLAIGIVATQVLDWVGTYMLEAQDEETTREEFKTRPKQAYEKGVAKIAGAFGRTLTREEEKVWGWRFHKTFGILGGLQYLAMREKYPKVKAGLGLAYGAGFFLIADEVMIYATGLVPAPQKFNWKVHARGAVAHTAYGVAAELTALAIENFSKVAIPEDQYLLPKKIRKEVPNYAS
jgi:uncharacterized membrane protein YagU involved in acid resistance